MLLSSEPPLGSLILGHVFCSGTSQHCDLGSRSPSPRPLTEKNAPSGSGHFLLQAKKKLRPIVIFTEICLLLKAKDSARLAIYDEP